LLKAKVTGWGLTVAKGSAKDVSTTLREVELKILPNYECGNFYNGEIYSEHILCAASPGKNACQGDSGDPMFLFENSRHTQIGVVSYGIGCANPNFPGVFARITHVKDWIKATAPGTEDSSCSNN